MAEDKKVTYVRLAPKTYKLFLHGNEYDVRVIGSGVMRGNLKPMYLEIDGKLEEVMVEIKDFEEVVEEVSVPSISISGDSVIKPKAQREGDVTTPIPGKIVEILVNIGDKVKVGQPILIVEAMKMDNELHAPKDGVISEIYVKVGDSVMPDEALIFID